MNYQPASRFDDGDNQYPEDIKQGHLDPVMEPLSPKHLDGLQERDMALKRRIRLLKLLVRTFTLLLSIYTVYTQATVLNNYLTTRNIQRNGRDPWAKDTYIWPTIVLLTTSVLTLIYSMITVSAYFWGGVKKANAASSTIGVPLVVLEVLAHMGIWIGTAVAYRVGKTGRDLWGWSCSPKADAIQAEFPEVDFSFLCSQQGNSWYVSIAQVVLFVVTAIVYGLAWRRAKHQKKVQRTRQSIMMASPGLIEDGNAGSSGGIGGGSSSSKMRGGGGVLEKMKSFMPGR